MICFYRYRAPRDLHVLTHSFPTRRSSDLSAARRGDGPCRHGADERALRRGTAPGGTERGRRADAVPVDRPVRSEEHTSELQSLMRISYAVFCLKKKTTITPIPNANPGLRVIYAYTVMQRQIDAWKT